MLNEKKVEIYQKYNGNRDLWARSANDIEKKAIDDDDWYLIESLIQDIKLIQKEMVSEVYAHKIRQLINEQCVNSSTIKMLFNVSHQ